MAEHIRRESVHLRYRQAADATGYAYGVSVTGNHSRRSSTLAYSLNSNLVAYAYDMADRESWTAGVPPAQAARNLVQNYVFGSYIDEVLCMVKANGDRFYYATNDLYSVYALTDSNGTVVERYMYDPYGKVTVLDGNGTPRTVNESLYGNPWTFTGRRLDGETGLMYFRNRMYDVGLGRFVSRDPAGYADGYGLQGAYFAYLGELDPLGLAIYEYYLECYYTGLGVVTTAFGERDLKRVSKDNMARWPTLKTTTIKIVTLKCECEVECSEFQQCHYKYDFGWQTGKQQKWTVVSTYVRPASYIDYVKEVIYTGKVIKSLAKQGMQIAIHQEKVKSDDGFPSTPLAVKIAKDLFASAFGEAVKNLWLSFTEAEQGWKTRITYEEKKFREECKRKCNARKDERASSEEERYWVETE